MIQCVGSVSSVPLSQHGVPWLVYPSQGTKRAQQKFYSFVDGRVVEERYAYHHNHYTCVAVAHSWMLLQGYTSCKKMFLFNPFTSKRFPLPNMIDEDPDLFFILSHPGKVDCFVVGVFVEDHTYFMYASPRGKKWKKHCLFNINEYCSILGAASSYNGKVYIYTSLNMIFVIEFDSRPKVKCFETKFPYNITISLRCELIIHLVASFGNLFLVEIVVYFNTDPKLVRTLRVWKLDISSKTWAPTDTLNDCVFIVGIDNPSSFAVANTTLKGNCIYYVSDNVLYCFNVKYKSLTTIYPFSDTTFNICCPFWLLPDGDLEMNHEEKTKHIREKTRSLMCSYEKFLFDHHKLFSPPISTSKGFIIQSSRNQPRWYPRTPLLMFAHKDDGNFKVMNPCSKTVYDLLVPDLLGSIIFASIEGWLFAQEQISNFFFINPFSKEKIKIPCMDYGPFGVAFSAPPTNPDCKIFFISQSCEDEPTVQISIYQPYDDKKITRKFEDTGTFQLAHSNAVYLNECFYCLGMDGNLGVYNPTNDSWRLMHTSVDIESEAHNCTLVQSHGKLLSVFTDLFQRPIGMFQMDLDLYSWKRIIDMGDRTFFFGQGSSFCTTAPCKSMKNIIYFPTFKKECSYDLVNYSLPSIGSVSDISTSAKTGYIHIWMEPK